MFGKKYFWLVCQIEFTLFQLLPIPTLSTWAEFCSVKEKSELCDTHVLWRISRVMRIRKHFLKRTALVPLSYEVRNLLTITQQRDIPVMSSRSSSYLCTSPCRELCSRGLWGSFWSSWRTAPGPPPAPPPGALEGQGHGHFCYQGPGSEPHPGIGKTWSFFVAMAHLSPPFFTTTPLQCSLFQAQEKVETTLSFSPCV